MTGPSTGQGPSMDLSTLAELEQSPSEGVGALLPFANHPHTVT